jgi:hypothetical protein
LDAPKQAVLWSGRRVKWGIAMNDGAAGEAGAAGFWKPRVLAKHFKSLLDEAQRSACSPGR